MIMRLCVQFWHIGLWLTPFLSGTGGEPVVFDVNKYDVYGDYRKDVSGMITQQTIRWLGIEVSLELAEVGKTQI